MEKIKVANGMFWVTVPEVDLRVLCACPADSVKHLMKKGLISACEKKGVTCETGPNAILLSDVPLQGGRFCNLAEFPVLQMLYKQGMLLPKHPNNTGAKPMLIGVADQVRAQAEYIFRGNYGLASQEEITATGIEDGLAAEMMRLKRRFAFGKILSTEELLDLRVVDEAPVELKAGVFIQRKGVNLYEFRHGDEALTVDLNLQAGEQYEATYTLECHRARRDYFSVIHIGEGDGWDMNRPCMSCLLTHQGKIYLIDAGPNILESLTALGISVNEIEGLFHTHAHDDHFNGLTVLMRSDHRIRYFATPLVRASVVKKLCGLMDFDAESFERYFEVTDLDFDTWNNIAGLEVMPVLSPHPVETSILFFRVPWDGGHKTYAHLADIASFKVLSGMITDDPARDGISQDAFDTVWRCYLTPVDLKKIDAGAGHIHGEAEDFINDASGKIILSHTNQPLTPRQKEIGAGATFGMADVLVPARQDYHAICALQYLRAYFPSAADHELEMLRNFPVVTFNPGSFVIRKNAVAESVFLMLSGVLEYLDTDNGIRAVQSAGALVGESAVLSETPCPHTYRSISYVDTLRIPAGVFVEFLKRNRIIEEARRLSADRDFLQNTWLFGDMLSHPVANRIARAMRCETYVAGRRLPIGARPELFLVREGTVDLFRGDQMIEKIRAGDFVGEDTILFESHGLLKATVKRPCRVCRIPADTLTGIPIVQWKLLETLERRFKVMGMRFHMEFRKDLRIHVEEMDAQHKLIFNLLADLLCIADAPEERNGFVATLEQLIEAVNFHFHQEEELMKRIEYPDAPAQTREHVRLAAEAVELRRVYESHAPSATYDLLQQLKDEFIDHTLLEDRKYAAHLNARGLTSGG